MIRIILLGPPGSGKGTQAYLIANKYNITNISAGEILRQSLLSEQTISNNSNAILRTINSGNLVDDALIIKLVIARINNKCAQGFILDGFPRTINQAISIVENDIVINFVIEFDIPDFIIVDRIVGRQMHLNSGRIYHIKYNPPKFPGFDDITGEKLIIRKDDNIQSVQQRLIQYHKYNEIISEYYKKKSKENVLFYHIIDGNRKVDVIYKELIDIFSSYIHT